MTPLELAQNMARSEDLRVQAYAVAIVYRGLTDEDPSDPLRLPWPQTNETIERAATYLGIEPSAALRNEVRRIAPTLSDATLNRRSTR